VIKELYPQWRDTVLCLQWKNQWSRFINPAWTICSRANWHRGI